MQHSDHNEIMTADTTPGQFQAAEFSIVTHDDIAPRSPDQDGLPIALERILRPPEPNDRPSALFAILDAARIPFLPERLETEGCAFKCLFKNKLMDELGSVAPWLVHLDMHSNLLRDLLTLSDDPQHYWGDQPALYLHSRASLDELWSHLRRFTRIATPDDKGYFFRFWETDILPTALQADPDGCGLAFFGKDMVDQFIAISDDKAQICTPSKTNADRTRVIRLTPGMYQAFSDRAVRKFWQKQEETFLAASNAPPVAFRLLQRQIEAIGLRSSSAIANLVLLCATHPTPLLDEVWARQELDESLLMPDPVRIDRLKNLANKVIRDGS